MEIREATLKELQSLLNIDSEVIGNKGREETINFRK